MKNLKKFALYSVLIVLVFIVTCRVFDSSFAELTIDYFAFFAGIFLIVEGIYKIVTSKERSAANMALRTTRVVIGTCVFTIHLLQFMRY